MSKTLGNVIDPVEIVDEFGTDAFRYYVIRELSSYEDSDFTIEKVKESFNANLANGIGNLTSRILKMSGDHIESIDESKFDKELSEEYKNAFDRFDFKLAADIVWDFIGSIDSKIQETEPFKLVKEDKLAAQKIITELVKDLYKVSVMLKPIIPETAEKIREAVLENKKPETALFQRRD